MSAEFHDMTELPAVDNDARMPADERMPVEETVPTEEKYSFDEFNVRSAPRRESEERHVSLKKLFLKPVAALILVGAVVVASLGIDPLSMAADTIEPPEQTAPVPVEPDGPGTDVEPSPQPGVPDEPEPEPTPSDEPDEPDEPDETPPPEEEEDFFPALSNLDPDFAGDYAWSEEGSEEYVRIYTGGESFTYLQKGAAWAYYDAEGEVKNPASGAWYDKSANVLHMTGFDAEVLDVNLMGNGFTIELNGDSHVGSVSIWGAMYAGSVTFTGSGSLTVDGGLYLNCEASASCIIVHKGVTLDISGEPAVVVGDTTLEGGIFMSKYLKLVGGEIVQLGDEDDEYQGQRLYLYTVVNEEGEPATHVRIEPADE